MNIDLIFEDGGTAPLNKCREEVGHERVEKQRLQTVDLWEHFVEAIGQAHFKNVLEKL